MLIGEDVDVKRLRLQAVSELRPQPMGNLAADLRLCLHGAKHIRGREPQIDTLKA